MNRINQESLKSYTLVALILTSLIQIGILWNYQYQNIPIDVISSFFTSHFGNSQQPPPLEADEYIKPYRIIASEGIDEAHWAIYKNNEAYSQLWNDFKNNYLEQVLTSNPTQSFTQDQWSTFINAKSFIFENKPNINFEIFAGLLGVKDLASNRPTGIYKVLISPWEDVNNNLITIYVLDDSKVHKYILPIGEKGLSKDSETNSFESIIKKLQATASLRKYMFFKELIPGKPPFPISPDILGVAKGTKESKYISLKNIIISTPEWLVKNANSDLESIAQRLLQNERDNFDSSVDNSNSIVLRNSNNIFKVNVNGTLEYKYLSEPEVSDKGSVYEAFKKAREFVGLRKDLLSGVEIYLSGISVNKENKGMYDFTFDYKVDNTSGDIPIVFVYALKDGEETVIKNAISITADSLSVINCRWILRNVVQGKETNLYNIDFIDSLKEIPKYNKADNKTISIKDIGLGYDVQSETANNLVPAWIITSEKGENFPVQMQRKKGD